MIRLPRLAVSLTAFLFGVFQLVLGVLWLGHYHDPLVGLAAIGIYLASIVGTILCFKGLRIPSWMALLNLGAAVLIPAIANTQIAESDYGTYATWYVGGIGIMLGATALRGQSSIAWLAALLASVLITLEESFGALFQSGLIGMIMLVLVGEATNKGLTRAEDDIARLVANSEHGLADLARTEAVRLAQVNTFNHSLPKVEPILRRVIASGGKLSDEERREALLVEAELSDEIMGGALVTEAVRSSARLARLRGVEVYLFDDGGLQGVQNQDFEDIIERITQVINEQKSGKVIVRSPKGETWRVTVSAYERGAVSPNVQIRL
jgi:hypothetical protein